MLALPVGRLPVELSVVLALSPCALPLKLSGSLALTLRRPPRSPPLLRDSRFKGLLLQIRLSALRREQPRSGAAGDAWPGWWTRAPETTAWFEAASWWCGCRFG